MRLLKKFYLISILILVLQFNILCFNKDLGDLGAYVIMPLMYLPANTETIYASELQKKDNLKEVLEDFSSLEITDLGYNGSINTARIRGSFSNQVPVLINNVPINSSSGLTDLNNISLENVDYVEIIKGPSSSLYGGNALGGVIKIFTKEGYSVIKPVTDFNINLGSYGYENYYGSFNFTKGKNEFFLSWFKDCWAMNAERSVLKNLGFYS